MGQRVEYEDVDRINCLRLGHIYSVVNTVVNTPGLIQSRRNF